MGMVIPISHGNLQITNIFTAENTAENTAVFYRGNFTEKSPGNNVYIVRIKTSMLIVKITGMLYIRHNKIRFLKVFHRGRDSAK